MSVQEEEIVAPGPEVSGVKPPEHLAGLTKLTIDNRPEAPLEETDLKVLLELTGSGEIEDRSPVDLVTVLDVSGSMQKDDRIGKLNIAMKFLIRKLSSIDRLSVVTFSNKATKLFGLRFTTDKFQDWSIGEVGQALKAGGGTNIAAGLEAAIRLLNDRRLKDNRAGAIMLMSDGEQNHGDARNVAQIDIFPVYTFGLGKDYGAKNIADSKSMVLNDIANKSQGGTFSDVGNEDDLSKAFSRCLGGLLTVVVQDLDLTIRQFDDESKIENVYAGNYPQAKNVDGSVSISFGNLYNQEVRKVLVDLRLVATKEEKNPDVLEVSYSHSAGQYEAPPVTATVSRSKTASNEEIPKVIVEENRLKTIDSVREAREMADKNNLDGARGKVKEAKSNLERVKVVDPKQIIKSLIDDLTQLLEYMATPEDYKKKGQGFALAMETSHNSMREAVKGDLEKLQSIFATPAMKAIAKQVEQFVKDPNAPVVPFDSDVKQLIAKENPPPSKSNDSVLNERIAERIADLIADKIADKIADQIADRIADPLGPIAADLSDNITKAIQALQSIENLFQGRTRRP